MLIDVAPNTISVKLLSKLKPKQISQINYLGFYKADDDNSYIFTSTDIGSVLQKLVKYLKRESVSYSLSPDCQKYINVLEQSRDSFEAIKNVCRDFKNGVIENEKIKGFNSFIATSVARKLKPHQLKAAFHLYLAGNSANFSVPGSGKTTVVLSVYEKLRSEGKVNLLFVVGPPACFWPWRSEFSLTLNRQPKVKILSGGEKKLRKGEYYNVKVESELYLTTYQTLLNDQAETIKFFDHQGVNVFLVIDEAHYMKQVGGNWANAVLRIASHAKYRCILTGTPLPKSYTDLFNLFDFLWPNNSPIDSRTKSQIKIMEKEGKRDSVKELLENTVSPLFYRVRKSDLALKPPVFHPPVLLKMNKCERIIYDAMENKIRDYAKKDYLKNISLVIQLSRGRMIRLRQCISYSKLLSSTVENYNEEIVGKEPSLKRMILDYDKTEKPAKLEYLTEFVKKMQKNRLKLIIWANFIGTLELIHKHLTKEGFYCKLIYGKTPFENNSAKIEIKEEDTREKIRNEFVEETSGLDILIANPAACAESISLHKTCFHALYYDLSYNCAQYIQSLDRIHRVGGSETKIANYYFLQYADTIDQDIKTNLDEKAAKMYSIIDEDYNIYSLDMFEDDDDVQAYQRLFKKDNDRI